MMTTCMYKKEPKTLCHSQMIKSQHTHMHKKEQKNINIFCCNKWKT